MPGGLKLDTTEAEEEQKGEEDTNGIPTSKEVVAEEEKKNEDTDRDSDIPPTTEPEALSSLRTLHRIRSRLQSVIHTFDSALSWPLPPSALSTSLVSISSAANTDADARAEEVGQAALQKLRDEIRGLLDFLGGEEGIEKAEKRVEELRALVDVWKGTAEEKARGRFVEGLGRVVGERRREWEAKSGRNSIERDGGGSSRASTDAGGRPVVDVPAERRGTPSQGGGGGFFRRLRDEIYSELD